MEWDLFSKWVRRRSDRKNLKGLGQLSSLFGTLTRLEEIGLLHWSEKPRRLYISDTLATLMLTKGAEGWAAFLNNVYLYVAYRRLSEMWDSHITVLQTKEIEKARKLTPSLTPAEIQRIKNRVTGALTGTEITPRKLEAFEFYILSDNPGTPPLQCGVYNPETDRFDIVDWNRISGGR